MRRTLALIAALAFCGPARADGDIRTLFVGIDHYKYTEAPDHDPAFHDLHGAVGDVAMIKTALAGAYKTLPVDNLRGGDCGAPGDYKAGGRSVTLVNGCATRNNIKDAFAAALAASKAGDTVLFYYAGHGSQIDDDAGIEYNGKNDTLVPADGRIDDAPEHADILGVELRAIIDGKPPGVKVVTIFDSCNSGKATRGLTAQVGATSRLAPPPPASSGARLRASVPATIAADSLGDVHLAAAADGVAANEVKLTGAQAGEVHGVFSFAITQALKDAANNGGHPVSYADIFGDATRIVTARGFGVQQPQAYGDLNGEFLGRGSVAVNVAPVSRDAKGALSLSVGRLSGVTAGSVYGLFPTSAEAGGQGAPTATARVDAGVGEFSATLTPSGPVPPGPNLWAREITHRFELNTVKVRIDSQAGRAAEITGALRTLDAVELVDDNPAYVFRQTSSGDIEVVEATGLAVGDPISGTLPASDFATKVTEAATRIARYHEVLNLAATAAGDPPKIWIGLPTDRAPPPTGGGSRWPPTPYYKTGLVPALTIALTNTAQDGRFIYLIDLEEDRSLLLVYPDEGAQYRLEAGHTVIVPPEATLQPTSPGRSQLLLLTTANAIDPSVFNQRGVGRGAGVGQNALEHLLAAAAHGSRGAADTPIVADWGAATAVVDVQATAPAKP